ncbi:MAG TPA: FIST N-terminal domain-containing protein [Steroidobacteraceae bacterium]|nr:FIST N-terminal domain-containing protein [Steroidobacteraceae bacterium]
MATDEHGAAAEISAQIAAADGGFTILFCTAPYELGALGRALHALGHGRVVAAATSRAIGRAGFLAKGVTGLHLPTGRFKVADALIEDAAEFGLPDARALVKSLRGRLERGAEPGLSHLFGLLLVDAEAHCEERLVAALGMELGRVPIVGGSAGDDYFNPAGRRSAAARILHHGRALRGAAVFCLIACQQPVLAVCHSHYVPGRRRLVISDADPERRMVREIDGRNALRAYAAACGLKTVPRDAESFSPFPLMIRIGGEYFARGIQRVFEDGSLEFACAMEPGLVVTLGRPADMRERLSGLFQSMQASLGKPEVVIAFECAARTAYMEQQGLTEAIAAELKAHNVVGFATLGEQFNTIHVNNSFTCLAVAAPQ